MLTLLIFFPTKTNRSMFQITTAFVLAAMNCLVNKCWFYGDSSSLDNFYIGFGYREEDSNKHTYIQKGGLLMIVWQD